MESWEKHAENNDENGEIKEEHDRYMIYICVCIYIYVIDIDMIGKDREHVDIISKNPGVGESCPGDGRGQGLSLAWRTAQDPHGAADDGGPAAWMPRVG